MVGEDFVSRAWAVIDMVLQKAWVVIKWPMEFIVKLPDWVVGILFGIILSIVAYILLMLWKSYKNKDWKFVDP